jgi:putative Holliday junction resolvase
MASLTTDKTYLAIDIGSRRIGVAIAQSNSCLPQPLTTLTHTDKVIDQLTQLIRLHKVSGLVVGVPRGLDGQITDQTRYTEAFVEALAKVISIPVYKQDEAVTSKQAEAELTTRNKPYSKGDVDALAATYILDDFLQQSKIESI